MGRTADPPNETSATTRRGRHSSKVPNGGRAKEKEGSSCDVSCGSAHAGTQRARARPRKITRPVRPSVRQPLLRLGKEVGRSGGGPLSSLGSRLRKVDRSAGVARNSSVRPRREKRVPFPLPSAPCSPKWLTMSLGHSYFSTNCLVTRKQSAGGREMEAPSPL